MANERYTDKELQNMSIKQLKKLDGELSTKHTRVDDRESIEVKYNSDTPIAGFEFDIFLFGSIVTSAGGGAAEVAGFTIILGDTTVMGFSLQGNTIPAGEGVLVVLEVSGGASDACLVQNGLVLSDSDGNALDATVSDCTTISIGECVDDDATTDPVGGCAEAVAMFGCDMVWGSCPYCFPLSEICPVTCDTCDAEDVYGCMDEIACNYNSDAAVDDGSCDYAVVNYDCIGNCITIDDCGVCDGDGSIGCHDHPTNGDEGGNPPNDPGTYCCSGPCLADNERYCPADSDNPFWYLTNPDDCMKNDECGECDGGCDLQGCGCDGICYAIVDDCGVCNGNNCCLQECTESCSNIPVDTCNCEGEGNETVCGSIYKDCWNDCECFNNIDFDEYCDEEDECLDGGGIIDECGVCDGSGIADGDCDCDGNVYDCTGECGGDAVEDDCGVCNGDNSCFEPPGLWHKWGERPPGSVETCDNYCLSINETCLNYDDTDELQISACPAIKTTQWWYNRDPDSQPQNQDHFDHSGLNGIPDCDALDYVGVDPTTGHHYQHVDGATVNCTSAGYRPPGDMWPEYDTPRDHAPSAHGWKLGGDGKCHDYNWYCDIDDKGYFTLQDCKEDCADGEGDWYCDGSNSNDNFETLGDCEDRCSSNHSCQMHCQSPKFYCHGYNHWESNGKHYWTLEECEEQCLDYNLYGWGPGPGICQKPNFYCDINGEGFDGEGYWMLEECEELCVDTHGDSGQCQSPGFYCDCNQENWDQCDADGDHYWTLEECEEECIPHWYDNQEHRCLRPSYSCDSIDFGGPSDDGKYWTKEECEEQCGDDNCPNWDPNCPANCISANWQCNLSEAGEYMENYHTRDECEEECQISTWHCSNGHWDEEADNVDCPGGDCYWGDGAWVPSQKVYGTWKDCREECQKYGCFTETGFYPNTWSGFLSGEFYSDMGECAQNCGAAGDSIPGGECDVDPCTYCWWGATGDPMPDYGNEDCGGTGVTYNSIYDCTESHNCGDVQGSGWGASGEDCSECQYGDFPGGEDSNSPGGGCSWHCGPPNQCEPIPFNCVEKEIQTGQCVQREPHKHHTHDGHWDCGTCEGWTGGHGLGSSLSNPCIIEGGPNDGERQRSFFYWYWPGAYPDECSCYNHITSGVHMSQGGHGIIAHQTHGAVKHQTTYPQMGGIDYSDFEERPHDEGAYWGRISRGGPWYNVYERHNCNHYNGWNGNRGDTAENYCCCTDTQEHETYDHSA